MKKVSIITLCLFVVLCSCVSMLCACQGSVNNSWFPIASKGKGIVSWQLSVKDHKVVRCILRTDDGICYDYNSANNELSETSASVSSSDTALLPEQLGALANAVDSFIKENDSSGKSGYVLSLMQPSYAFGADYMQTLSAGKLAVYSISVETVTALDSDEYSGSKSYGVVIPTMTDDPEFGNSPVTNEWIILIDD